MKRARRLQRRHRRQFNFRKLISGFSLFMLIIASAPVAFCAEEPAEQPASADAGNKLAEGIEETATGWVEAPEQIAETSESTNPVEGVTVGAVKGAGEATEKTVEGAIKTATFYVPDEDESAPNIESEPLETIAEEEKAEETGVPPAEEVEE
jgi:putative exosortase-associated protein (TIGR04073 family)